MQTVSVVGRVLTLGTSLMGLFWGNSAAAQSISQPSISQPLGSEPLGSEPSGSEPSNSNFAALASTVPAVAIQPSVPTNLAPANLAPANLTPANLGQPGLPTESPTGPKAPEETGPRLPKESVPDEAKPTQPTERNGSKAGLAEPEPARAQVLKAVTNSAKRYPSFVNPTGNDTLNVFYLHPNRLGHSTHLDFKSDGQGISLQTVAHQYFAPSQQLYWVLPGNRIAIETQGWQADLEYQGRELNTTVTEKVKVTQSLWGLQAVWIIPQALQDLVGQDTLQQSAIETVAGEVINPAGIAAPPVIINTSNSNRNRLSIVPPALAVPRPGTGSTNNPAGGGELFQLLELGNSPKILQAFPTNNLQALLIEGEGLFAGAQIPKGVLSQAGIAFGNPLTGKGFVFQPEITSVPGIKIAQGDKFDNRDLLNVLVNPFLSQKAKDLAYLNSLHWVSLGLKPPIVLDTMVDNQNKNWYALRLHRPHNRTLLQYEAAPGQATYYNVFANLGMAISYSFDKNAVNGQQSINATLGALLGTAFELIKPYRIEKSLWEARLRLSRDESFTPLRTQTTSAQRQQINQRLERMLSFASRGSGIDRVSGSFSFPSRITPDRSTLWQIRAGTRQRRIQFSQVEQTWLEGESYISKLRLSNRVFGPLTLIGTLVPRDQTGLGLSHRSTSIQTTVIRADGTPLFQLNNDTESTVVPMQVRAFDIAFDSLDLSQIGTIVTHFQGFDGTLHLPAVEGLWAGSKGKFNYTLTAGLWLNLDPRAVPGLISDGLGRREPRLGAYAKASLNWATSRITKGRDQQVQAVTSQIPSIQLAWNNAANASNPNYATFNYAYLRQTGALNYAVSVGIFFAAYTQKLESILFVRGQLGLKMGLEISASLEVGQNFWGSVEGLQALSPRWSIGAYGQNFQTTVGLKNRVSGTAYGLVIQHRPAKNNTVWQAKVGMNNDGLDIQLAGTLMF